MPLEYRVASKAIRKILLKNWDPLWVRFEEAPEGEYDGFIPTIYRMLVEGADDCAIAEYLDSATYETMGLPPSMDLDLLNMNAAQTLHDELAWLSKK